MVILDFCQIHGCTREVRHNTLYSGHPASAIQHRQWLAFIINNILFMVKKARWWFIQSTPCDSCNSETRSQKIDPKIANKPSLQRLQTGHWQNLRSCGKKRIFGPKTQFLGPKKEHPPKNGFLHYAFLVPCLWKRCYGDFSVKWVPKFPQNLP